MLFCQIRHGKSRFCLSAEHTGGRLQKGARLLMQRCKRDDRTQVWRWTELNELRPMGSSRLCLDANKGLRLMKCHMQQSFQEWKLLVSVWCI